ncbi:MULTISPECIES: class I SAM-dependent methyltransferase [Massilia]|uniref:Methyltransferase n=1 Tax=Massilia aurea TaxID=373040 RepID=A0A422QF25_9BURK|nr:MULTISPECIES: methyltransferase domain-containing protein [Massilia]MDY0965337.1 methyltransferase domain-containing protein [Massilia sp. CFBP9026]RNF28611.1 methyltransferase [Massilia aurea]
MKRLILAAMLATGLAGAAHADDALKSAIAGEHRAAANKARDTYRHPYETLTFFGIKPTMTVIELSPGGGWYTEILAPYLRDQGKLYGAVPDAESRGGKAFRDRMAANGAVYGKVTPVQFAPPDSIALGAPNSVDMVVTFRNLHNWLGNGDDAVLTVLKEAHKVLKPGGVLGVVEHRLPAKMTQDAKASSGYMHEAYVIRMAERAGFKLAAKSEVNANPKDTADHEKGVWSLPPVLTNKDKDREKYLAIGESDRMTLKFVKQ